MNPSSDKQVETAALEKCLKAQVVKTKEDPMQLKEALQRYNLNPAL